MPILMPEAKMNLQKRINLMFEQVKAVALNVSRPSGRQGNKAINL
jgi:hypothetical protein